MAEELNQDFIFNQIRKYNQARRQIYRDKALLAVGIHAGLLKKFKAIAPELSEEDRRRVLSFLRHFLASSGCKAEIAEETYQ